LTFWREGIDDDAGADKPAIPISGDSISLLVNISLVMIYFLKHASPLVRRG